jgi:C-terminal, D2-small domain, of ClpB protein
MSACHTVLDPTVRSSEVDAFESALRQRVVGQERACSNCAPIARASFSCEKELTPNYGARHLKRSIERHLVCPLANLIATAQIGFGDLVIADYDFACSAMTFLREDHGALVGELERAAIGMPVVGPGELTYSADTCAFQAAQN